MELLRITPLLVCLILSGLRISSAQRSFTLVNQCTFTVWPGTQSNAGLDTLFLGGTTLDPTATFQFTAPAGWAGRFWGRALCSFDSSGNGVCATGDCGEILYCNGKGGNPPATLVEMKLDASDLLDYYDVSLVDGYNLPLSIDVTGGTGNCYSPSCPTDVNLTCPPELQYIVNGEFVACMSACEAFKTDQYCCTGANNIPATCPPTKYSEIFKAACPDAFSYAFDDQNSTYTCLLPSAYTITFCPVPL